MTTPGLGDKALKVTANDDSRRSFSDCKALDAKEALGTIPVADTVGAVQTPFHQETDRCVSCQIKILLFILRWIGTEAFRKWQAD